MLEEPDAERSWEGVTAREKMSVGWALGMVCVWRYCFDCTGLGRCAHAHNAALYTYHGCDNLQEKNKQEVRDLRCGSSQAVQ